MSYQFVDLETEALNFSSPTGMGGENPHLEYARGRWKPVKKIINRVKNASSVADRFLPKEVIRARNYGINAVDNNTRRIQGWMGADGEGGGFASLTPFDGQDDELEYAKGKGKAFFGKIGKGLVSVAKVGANIAANSGVLPGGPLVQALAQRIGTPPTPAGVVQGAQTPAEAAAVVAAIAPALPAPQAAQAVQLVSAANNPVDAQSVAQALMNAQASSLSKKSKDKTLLYIGGGLALAVIVVLGIVLARRK
jgi:hypothetical protein